MSNKLYYFFFVIILVTSCSTSSEKVTEPDAPKDPLEWTRNAVMYEVNVRQHTPEGTFEAFSKDLPRLKRLGIDILWFMPIHPIGEKNRKGDLGSYYSVYDYTEIHPDYGTKEDFRKLVNKAHEMGFKVMIDWVANHSAFDNPWAIENPDWYTRDSLGNIIHPADTDWTDVADLNYENKDMRKAMIEALKYWVEEFDIDGYRCDVAGFVPVEFWLEARSALDSIRPLFMLAEWEAPEYHEAFHMTYGWEFHHITNMIGKGEFKASALKEFYTKDTTRFPKNAYRLNFITNHDENSWNGTVFERYGDAADAMAGLFFVFEGMPLMYSGQEASMSKRLSFFGKDTIDWTNTERIQMYQNLIRLHHEHPALQSGGFGAPIKFYDVGSEDVLIMERTDGKDYVLSIFNFSDETKSVELQGINYGGKPLKNVLDGIEFEPKGTVSLHPWQFMILTN